MPCRQVQPGSLSRWEAKQQARLRSSFLALLAPAFLVSCQPLRFLLRLRFVSCTPATCRPPATWSRESGASATCATQHGPKRLRSAGWTQEGSRPTQSNSALSLAEGPPEPLGPPSEHAPSRDLSDSDIAGALVDIAREAIILPMASKSTQPTVEVADSESDDNASCPRSAKPRPLQGGLALQPWKPSGPSKATKRASDLLIPSNSPCLPGAFPKPRAAAPGGPACPPPSHWEDRKGAWPPPALPKPAPAVRPRARSLAGPYSLSSLASASRVPNRPLRTFSLPQPSLALNQHFAAQGQPVHQLQGHILSSLHRRKQPSALEDSAAYQHGQVCCKPWVPQASSGHKFSRRSTWQTTWPHQSGSTPWGPWKPTSRSALGS